MWSKVFWKATAERALKTFAQAVIALWAASDVGSLLSVNLQDTLAVGGMAAVVSVLTSILSAPVGNATTPSLLPNGEERE